MGFHDCFSTLKVGRPRTSQIQPMTDHDGLNPPVPSPGSMAAPVNQKHSPQSPGRLQLVKNARAKGMLCPCGILKQPLLSQVSISGTAPPLMREPSVPRDFSKGRETRPTLSQRCQRGTPKLDIPGVNLREASHRQVH